MASAIESLPEPIQSEELFFVLSGEHSTLPAAEIQAILESAGLEFGRPKQSYRLLTLEAPAEALRRVSERSLMYDWCGVNLGRCEADDKQILRLIKSLPLEDLTKNAETFAVRSVRLGGVSRTIRRTELERNIGGLVKHLLPRLSVRLRDPELTFACVLFGDSFLFGVSAYSKPSGLIAPRRPRKRPVFHPSTMPPKIARCMVNLARARPGATFADPFSGVGGILIEAAVIGCNILGMDASLRMLRGARRNTKYFGLEASGFLRIDAREMPLREIDAMATDPPYGRGSSTMGAKVSNLVEDFLAGAKWSLNRGGHICISAPVEVDVEGYARAVGFTVKERHLLRVHRSLTRQFVVLQNA
jgi:tRNA (guanine10-N2)-dimethyltransferase